MLPKEAKSIQNPDAHVAGAHLSEADMRHVIELLFFAYRDFTGVADAILDEYGFGRAHHRVIYFVKQNPGITVNRLLDILKITKQSLSRVLGQLVREGFVNQRADADDRRRRILSLTLKGDDLERQLTEAQSEHIRKSYATLGSGDIQGFKDVLTGIINEDDRLRFGGGGPHTEQR